MIYSSSEDPSSFFFPEPRAAVWRRARSLDVEDLDAAVVRALADVEPMRLRVVPDAVRLGELLDERVDVLHGAVQQHQPVVVVVRHDHVVVLAQRHVARTVELVLPGPLQPAETVPAQIVCMLYSCLEWYK